MLYWKMAHTDVEIHHHWLTNIVMQSHNPNQYKVQAASTNRGIGTGTRPYLPQCLYGVTTFGLELQVKLITDQAAYNENFLNFIKQYSVLM